MGNMWTTTKVLPVNGTYLEDRPRRYKPIHTRVASFIPIVQQPILQVARHKPPVPYKEKARRMFHELAVRRQALGRVGPSYTTLTSRVVGPSYTTLTQDM